ncbi:MAG: anthrone oxygenase family protein [Kribbellaceae bacterium]
MVLACFLGALVLTALAAVLHLRADLRPALWWILAGLALYVLVLVITGVINIPLNAIEAAGEVADRRCGSGAGPVRGGLRPVEHRPRGALDGRRRQPPRSPDPVRPPDGVSPWPVTIAAGRACRPRAHRRGCRSGG